MNATQHADLVIPMDPAEPLMTYDLKTSILSTPICLLARLHIYINKHEDANLRQNVMYIDEERGIENGMIYDIKSLSNASHNH